MVVDSLLGLAGFTVLQHFFSDEDCILDTIGLYVVYVGACSTLLYLIFG